MPTPTPTPTPDDDDDDIDADDLADILEALARAGGGGPQQQQQQQQALPIPVAAVGSVGGGAKLPKTGVDVAEVGGIGTLSLLTGVGLMEYARRRRRDWLAPATAAEAMAITPKQPAIGPVGGEGDLLLPYSAPTATAVAPKPEPHDFITPGF